MEVTCAPDVYLDPELEKKALKDGLSRIQGQLGGVKRMLDEHQSYDQILVQLAAIKSAVNGTARQLLEGHMEACVLESERAGEVEEAFERLKGAMARFLEHA